MLQNLQILGFCLGIFSFAAVFYCLWRLKKMGQWQKAFFQGKNGGDLENIILQAGEKIKNLENENLLVSREIKSLQSALGFTIQKVGLVRYSPFADGGGNYSFSLALLDGHNSGVVITNMYGRQQSRVYTKKLAEGKSEVQLTEEEARAINLANNNKN